MTRGSPIPQLATALGLCAALGVAACSEGCSHELPVSDAPEGLSTEPMTIEELRERLWPSQDEDWVPLSEAKLSALERLVGLLVARAEAGAFSARQARMIAKFAQFIGMELHQIQVEIDGETQLVWLLTEPVDQRHGRGSFLIRVGAVAAEERAEYLLQAPHSFYDKHSGEIALGVFLEPGLGRGRARALFVNSVHRHRKPGGAKKKLEEPEQNPADAAHASEHPIARATVAALARRSLVVVQVHGFERKAESGDPDVIVSAGLDEPRAISLGVEARMRAAFPEFSVGHYGVDTDRLGAETNLQGQAARAAGRCFVHVEISGQLRDHLRAQRSARQALAGVLFGAEAKELRGGCR